MSGKSKRKFSGALNEPIYRRPVGLLTNLELENERFIGVLTGRFDLLFEHYGIETENEKCWRKLAVALALDLVPGMQIAKHPLRRKGRPKKWHFTVAQKFVSQVDEISAERSKGIKDAIRILVRRSPDQWLTKNGRQRKTEKEIAALETRYHSQKARLHKLSASVSQMGGLLGLGNTALEGLTTKNRNMLFRGTIFANPGHNK